MFEMCLNVQFFRNGMVRSNGNCFWLLYLFQRQSESLRVWQSYHGSYIKKETEKIMVSSDKYTS